MKAKELIHKIKGWKSFSICYPGCLLSSKGTYLECKKYKKWFGGQIKFTP